VTIPTLKYPHSFDIKSERLTLRPPIESDAKPLFPFVSDPRVTEFLAWEPHKTIPETEQLVTALRNSQLRGEAFHWLINFGSIPCGIISIIDVKRTHRCWRIDRGELAYWVAPSYQGKGIATEACQCVIRFGFNELKLNKLLIMHAPENVNSSAIPERLGFRKVGVFQKAFLKGGKWFDLVAHELLFSNWHDR
jgi:RimJ/RimL family protein N-acetyltransferase